MGERRKLVRLATERYYNNVVNWYHHFHITDAKMVATVQFSIDGVKVTRRTVDTAIPLTILWNPWYTKRMCFFPSNLLSFVIDSRKRTVSILRQTSVNVSRIFNYTCIGVGNAAWCKINVFSLFSTPRWTIDVFPKWLIAIVNQAVTTFYIRLPVRFSRCQFIFCCLDAIYVSPSIVCEMSFLFFVFYLKMKVNLQWK